MGRGPLGVTWLVTNVTRWQQIWRKQSWPFIFFYVEWMGGRYLVVINKVYEGIKSWVIYTIRQNTISEALHNNGQWFLPQALLHWKYQFPQANIHTLGMRLSVCARPMSAWCCIAEPQVTRPLKCSNALLPSGPCLTVLAGLVRFHGSSSVLAAAFYIVICGDKLVNY